MLVTIEYLNENCESMTDFSTPGRLSPQPSKSSGYLKGTQSNEGSQGFPRWNIWHLGDSKGQACFPWRTRTRSSIAM